MLNIRAKKLKDLEYTRCFSDEGVFVGDTVTLTEVIYNNSFFPLLFVDVGFHIKAGLEIDGIVIHPVEQVRYFASRFHIMPYTRITRIHTVKCNMRNHYALDTVEIYGNKEYVYISAPTELFVYPELLPQNNLVPQVNRYGEQVSKNRFFKDRFNVSGIRSYQHGDSFSDINFKASARSMRFGMRELMVNNHDFSSHFNIMVYLNLDKPTDMLSEQYFELFEYSLSAAATLITEAVNKGGRVGFSANARKDNNEKFTRFEPSGGIYHMLEILKSMSVLMPSEGISIISLMGKDTPFVLKDSDICLMTMEIDDELENKIKQFKRIYRGVTVLLLNK